MKVKNLRSKNTKIKLQILAMYRIFYLNSDRFKL